VRVGAAIVWILLAVVVLLGGLVVVRRIVSLDVLKEQHEVAGVAFAVLGGLYGIILAFVLVSSWERFETARGRADFEASAAADIYRHAQGFGDPLRASLGNAVLAYLESVVDDEWPAMEEGDFSPKTQEIYKGIWRTVLESRPSENWEVALYQSTLSKLDDFGDSRRTRLLYMRSGLPTVLWLFLIVFGAATVGFTYFFGMRHIVAQAIITAILAATVTCSLLLISETQTPFSGELHLSSRPFAFVLAGLKRDSGIDPQAKDPPWD
jgi:hypothetical protein